MRSILCIVFFIVLSVFSFGQKKQLDSLLKAWHQNGQFDGTVLVAHQDSVVYQNAFGFANRSWNIPMTLDSRFEIASISKSMIGALILKLVEKDKLQLNDKIITYFPHFKDARASKITIHQMLTHSSGLGNYQDLPDTLKVRNWQGFKRLNFKNREEYAVYLAQIPLQSEPNTKVSYSNFAYFLLAALIEKIEKKTLEEVFQEQIAIPLKMKTMHVVFNNRAIIPNEVIGYNWEGTNEKADFYTNQFIDQSVRISIYGTVADLHRWALAMQDTTFLPKHLLDLMKTNHLADLGGTYGYGWAVHATETNYGMGNINIDKNYIIHGGALEGFRSMLTIIEEGEWIITHLSNIGNKTNELQLTRQIAKILME